MVEQIAREMLEDIKKRNRPKEDLLPYYIQKRLDKSIQTYYKQLLSSCDFLSSISDESKVIKKLAKL